MSASDEPRDLTVRIRPAIPGDLAAMAHVYVETWKSTYRGIVLDQFLDQLTVQRDIAKGFGQWLKNPKGIAVHQGALDWTGSIVGFARVECLERIFLFPTAEPLAKRRPPVHSAFQAS